MIIILIGWYIGTKLIFPMARVSKMPQIEGGMDRLRSEYNLLGKMDKNEYNHCNFVIVLVFGLLQTTWYLTDIGSLHGCCGSIICSVWV